MTVQIFPLAGGTASFDGVFIPVANLSLGAISGASEFADSETAAVKRDKALFAISEISTAYLLPMVTAGTVLGVSVGTPNKQSFSWAYSYTLQTYEKINGSTPLAPLPIPVVGTGTGVGDFALIEIFAGAAKVASGATVAGSGVLIETAPLARYGSPAHAELSVSGDNRNYLNAFFRWMASSAEVPLKSNSTLTPVLSAVTAKNASAPVVFSLPTAAIAATNPTTALSSADSDVFVLIAIASSVTFKMKGTGPDSNGNIAMELDSTTT